MNTKYGITLALMLSIQAFAQPEIHVTNGHVTQNGNEFEVASKSSRFELVGSDGEGISVHVKYKGLTDEKSLLGSGNFVSQVALKLRSVNQCNLVYVARRIQPKSEISVFIKENKGQSTHEECENGGYKRIVSVPVPSVKAGDSFSLAGSFSGNNLTVHYNGEEVWSGDVPWNHKGDSGVRTDNAKVSIRVDSH